MTATPKLHVERVEDRTVPANFGLPWLSPTVTVSFVPDGTLVDGVKSTLNATLAASGLTPAVWQGEILRAFQTWAAVSNLNFGVVGDGGQAVGTAGRLQADTRFGDIRVSARPLDQNVLAITTPPGYTSETRAGDIVFNSNFQFCTTTAANKYDVYTVVLQEVGHALGLGNSTDDKSVMSEVYQGKRATLSAGDIAAVRALYGSRTADATEGTVANMPSFAGTTTLFARGDLTTATDADTFAFTTPSSLPNGVKVKLTTAGVSLLAGRVDVLDSYGRVVASGSAAAGENRELSLTGLRASSRYTVRVSAPSGTAFRIGGYELRVEYDPAAVDPGKPTAPTVAVDGLKNETIAAATALPKVAGTTAQALYRTHGQIESWSDVDVYKVTAPTLPAGQTTTLTVQVASYKAGQNLGGLAAQAEVYDATGKLVATEELTYSHSRQTYQVRNVPGGGTYYVAVKANTFFSDRDYELTAYFATRAVNYAVTESRTISPQQPESFGTLMVKQTQVFTFHMSSGVAGGGYASSVYLEVFDAAGTRVHSVLGMPDVEFGTTALLTPGEYTVRLRAADTSATASLNITLRMDTLTDPIGLTAPSDPTQGTEASRTPSDGGMFDWISYAPNYYAWLM